MKRGEFLKNLGLSSAALMSFYCLGGVTACTSESPAPQNPPGGGGATGLTGNASLSKGKIDFALDLTTDTYKTLLTNGAFVYAGDVIVTRTKSGSYVALAKACTHQGTSVQYRSNENDFWCNNHGSEFTTAGAVKNGPAATALKVFQTELVNNKLFVSDGVSTLPK